VKVRNKCFSIQINQATACRDIGHLIAYVRYVEDTTITEDTLFYKSIKRRRRTTELLKIIDDFMKEKKHQMVRLCWSMHRCSSHNGGKKEGLQALIKPSAPEAIVDTLHDTSTSCITGYEGIIHRTERSDGHSDQNC
jgi:predicted nucleotidyltransferase